LAFPKTPKQKFLCHSAVENRVNQQNVAPLHVGSPTESNLAPRVTSLLHVANILPQKMANGWRVDVAYQIRPKYKAPIQGNHYIQPLAIARL
jgi:hypothetical protein